MILGTSIGAGMLALPVASAHEGFITSFILLFLCWSVMTAGAFLILEVVLWLPEHTNLISMAKFTIGKPGQIISWISYLLLLYALLCAYISGNSDVFQGVLGSMHIIIPRWTSTILVAVLLGGIVYRGIYSVDIVNRGLMSAKIIIYVLVVITIAPKIHITNLLVGHAPTSIATIMVIITSFGFAIIVPSLRTYFKSDVKKLRRTIFIGSLVPLVIYIIWIALVQGVLSHQVLQQLEVSLHTTTGLANSLSATTSSAWIVSSIHTFISICALTSFLGVSLCLFDFLADGLSLKKHGKQGLIVGTLTFLPPVIIILFAPGAFITALGYAGIFCVIILMLLPAIMAWSGRYIKKTSGEFQLFGGKTLLAIELILSIILIIWAIIAAF